MNKLMSTATVIFCFCVCPLFAFNDEPDCYKLLKTTFFQRRLVEQALSLSNANQSQWPLITQMLVDRSQVVPEIIKDRAQFMSPDPLEYPFNAVEALNLLKQVEFEVFAQVMRESGFFNENVIRTMFEYIYKKQDGRIRECLGIGAI